MTPDDLVDIEAIKQLKARYFRLMDTKQWNDWLDVFTEDCDVRWAEGPESRVEGRHATVDKIAGMLANAVTVHHGHMPEIVITGPGTATGVWAMFDYVERPTHTFHGFGHYRETYEKGGDGSWRIKRLHLTRLRIDPIERPLPAGGSNFG